MANILEDIAEHTRKRVEKAKRIVPLQEMKQRAESMDVNTGFPFEKKLKEPGISFICECKKASPSKGLITVDFPYLKIAYEYEKAGATAISVLTEPKWFKGSNEYLRQIAETVKLPCLRKDFTIDPYMIYEAKVLGAQIILLICALLDEETLKEYIGIADSLGLSAIVEAHDEDEVRKAVNAGARIIGVNNRNLKDFTVDISNSIRLRENVPEDILFIAESGIKSHDDIEELEAGHVNGVLIGETLMRAADKKAMLDELRLGILHEQAV
ncbi:indole-3-glycerol phosphate synthase TrpC [Oribacterium sp. WCC10]|uniref:indole-3-glycerol phosphate synthase TrpC n=1 Tax=Oribacterium sp. WCC10 TaxID=1855343 RepID=UPI0008EA33D0|nr:indole-3-glycerol phosphate synthase TrpC [Oribacterium sp. WCC10]SFG38143.1 indole-3-glycerol phosphate synthase [Oribacterium sp. WCC10]